MGILPYEVLCSAALCVFHISLLKVALSKVFDPDIEMKGESGAGPLLPTFAFLGQKLGSILSCKVHRCHLIFIYTLKENQF